MCRFSTIETKGTRGGCGGAWPQLCSACCLTGGSLLEEVEQDGGERVSPSLGGTGLLMTLSNLTRVCFWGRKERRHKVTAGRRQPTFIQGREFFLPKKMSWCSEIPLRENVHILVYVWCSSFVQYIVLVQFFALQHVSIFNDLHRPRKCLIQCLLPNEYWAILRCPGDQTSWFTIFQRGNFSEQSISHLTSMEHLPFHNFFILLSVFVFFHFL